LLAGASPHDFEIDAVVGRIVGHTPRARTTDAEAGKIAAETAASRQEVDATDGDSVDAIAARIAERARG
jgi:hypothetical protein